jgi:CRISPR/Cas system-associated endonuclease Cas1
MNFKFNHLTKDLDGVFETVPFSITRSALLKINNRFSLSLNKKNKEIDILNSCVNYPNRTPYATHIRHIYIIQELQPFLSNINIFKKLYVKTIF